MSSIRQGAGTQRSCRPEQHRRVLPVLAVAVLLAFCSGRPGAAQLNLDQGQIDQLAADYVDRNLVSPWPWGGLRFNRTYTFDVVVINKCPSPELVQFLPDSSLAPMITVERLQTVPPNQVTRIKVIVKTGVAGDFVSEMAWDPLTGYTLWTSVPIDGMLVVKGLVEEAWCIKNPRVYHAWGGIFKTPDDGVYSSCLTYWVPALLPPATWDCTDEFRIYALQYITTLGSPEELAESTDWSWLPTPEEIMRMSDLELLEMKRRAEAQRLGG